MEGDKSFPEDGPPAGNEDSNVPEENPTMLSPVVGDENKEPEENPIMSSPITGGENKEPEENPIISDENKRPPESPNHRKATSLGAAEFGNTSAQSIHDQKNQKEEEEEGPSSFHRRAVSVDQLVSKARSPTANVRSKLLPAKSTLGRSQIDTAAPIESVKAAVSKFGGMVDWKAHRVQTTERRKFIETELEKAQDEIPTYQQQCESAEEAKTQVLKELDGTKRLIEELKLNLERAQKEDHQAKQDMDLAKLRLEEIEQGIAEEVSISAKAQLEVAKARHVAAVAELKSVNEELEQLKKDYDLLMAEKDSAKKKAEEAVSSSREAEKSVQDLSIELIALKQSLESAHSEHLEVEEHRVGAIMAKEEYNVNWEEDLRQAEEEIEKLNQQVMATNELKMKLNAATSLLQDLKDELAVYLETKEDGMEVEGNDFLLTDKKTRGDIKTAINAAGKELLEVKIKIMKANEEGGEAKAEKAALESDLEKEKTELVEIQQRECKSSLAAENAEVELNAVKSEIEAVRLKEKEDSEKMAELPSKLEEVEKEAEHAKVVKEKAKEELMKAKEESEEAKSGKMNKENELSKAEKEIEASKAVEKLAMEAITVLEKSESDETSPTTGVTLSLEEYFELSKQALDAEEEANKRVASAMSEIEAAKETEERTLKKLEEVNMVVCKRKEELEMVRERAKEAEERKVMVEQELRKRKGEDQSEICEADLDLKVIKKKKKSFFPRFFMFMGKKKTQPTKD